MPCFMVTPGEKDAAIGGGNHGCAGLDGKGYAGGQVPACIRDQVSDDGTAQRSGLKPRRYGRCEGPTTVTVWFTGAVERSDATLASRLPMSAASSAMVSSCDCRSL